MDKLKKISRHPYFAFILLGVILISFQLLESVGVLKVSFVRGFGRIMIYSIVGLGFSILLGYSGLASLGTAGFIGVGSYTMSFLFLKSIPLGIIIVIAILIAIIIGGLVGIVSLRIEGMYLAIITLAISSLLVELFGSFENITGGHGGIQIAFKIFGMRFKHREVYYILVASLVLFSIITLNIISSYVGRAMLTMKNSTSAAQSMGISLLKYRLISFIIATIFAVLAGVLNMMYYQSAEPAMWTLTLSLNILAAVIVGGSKSIWGIFLGMFIIFGLDIIVLSNIKFFVENPAFQMVLNGALIIIIIMVLPEGLISLINKYYLKLKGKFINRKEFIDDHDDYERVL